MKNFKIGDRKVGNDQAVFIIAELSANHGHKYEIAADTIKAMKDSGADAVKLQTYTADTITLDSDRDEFKIKQGTIWDGKNLHKLYEEAYMPWEWQPKLKKLAEDLGLVCFSSPFDNSAADFLEEMDVPAYKIASFEITDIPLIEYVASKHKPVIISTGIAESVDIEEAIAACRRVGNDQIALLKCTSAYPAAYEEMNLVTIPDMAKKFDVIVGLSDHTLGIEMPVSAVSLGAKIIEKHFILNPSVGGPDASFSLAPNQFKEMVQSIRNTEKALGIVTYELSAKSKKSREFCRSLFVVEDVKAGEIFTEKNVRSIRPGYGLPPKHIHDILGKSAKYDICEGTPFVLEMVN